MTSRARVGAVWHGMARLDIGELLARCNGNAWGKCPLLENEHAQASPESRKSSDGSVRHGTGLEEHEAEGGGGCVRQGRAQEDDWCVPQFARVPIASESNGESLSREAAEHAGASSSLKSEEETRGPAVDQNARAHADTELEARTERVCDPVLAVRKRRSCSTSPTALVGGKAVMTFDASKSPANITVASTEASRRSVTCS
eukprot:CAMPEP_0181200710 /NCGR_PEP_ID=MMETSP1096-20121128/17915_1 /TAXON_ID=156174 ORGANISM="Chrysochromulina ericina, Strain CCMP281" /NCGR_SAMPLE_ID=MMETSP1096 /ASSEMBLY_ACC=CAM_ASM_000453 /LENGTH=200 /DNA_ID=CAMNT_0023291097 /DNA_START=335 /DNA_END=939 /DNA_ORIENTATION=+